jgi:hypothetical protein
MGLSSYRVGHCWSVFGRCESCFPFGCTQAQAKCACNSRLSSYPSLALCSIVGMCYYRDAESLRYNLPWFPSTGTTENRENNDKCLHHTVYERLAALPTPAFVPSSLRILYMPPIYAIISFLSYRFFRSYTYYSLVEVGMFVPNRLPFILIDLLPLYQFMRCELCLCLLKQRPLTTF